MNTTFATIEVGNRDKLEVDAEQWRDVIGYEGLYQVSDKGRVRRGGRLKSFALSGSGKYYRVTLSKRGQLSSHFVHRLVAAAWIRPCPPGLQVMHGVAGKYDNSVNNLSYGTASQNCLDKRRDGNNGGKRVIRSDGVCYPSIVEAAEATGCLWQNLSECCRGKRGKAGGYGWSYL